VEAGRPVPRLVVDDFFGGGVDDDALWHHAGIVVGWRPSLRAAAASTSGA
jgi:hypothetical protein